MRRFFFLLMLLPMMVAGCAVDPPDWARGQSSSYPASDYLTAVGVSRERASAEEKARQELLASFRWTPEAGDGEIAGMLIADVWHDRALGAYHALAVIDRHSAGQPLSAALAALERSIAGQVAAAEKSGSALLRWGHYLQAASLAEQRRDLATDLRRIDPAAEVPAAAYPLPQLNERRDRAAAGVGVEIRLRNDRDDSVKQDLLRALAERGLRLAPDFAASLHISGWVAGGAQLSGVSAVSVRIEMDGAGADSSELPVIDERADLQAIGDRLALRVVSAVTALTEPAAL